MADTIGRVDFIAGLDGNNLPREARRLGEKAGQEGGKGYSDGFDRSVTPRMRAAADRIGKNLNDKIRINDSVVRRNSLAIRTFGREGESSIDRLSNRVLAFAVQSEDSIRRAFGRSSGRIRTFWNDIDPGAAKLRKLNFEWKDLSHNTRQWTLIIGAVLAGMQHLSVLSSAAGAGLFSIGGALTGLVAGGGAAVAIFTSLAKDIEDLPPGMRGVAKQFRSLGTELKSVRDIISANAFKEMPDTFSRMRRTVSALNPQFALLGTSVGKVFDDFSKGIEEGSDGFVEIRKMISNATDDFPALAKAAGTWTVGLLRGINKANPMVDQLVGYVQKLGDRFDRFTRSSRFDQWIRNSMETWRRFGELLDSTGRALNNLVTPKSIVRTQAFLGNLTDFMPSLERLLDTLGRLDVFGLAAQLLNDFGAALAPLEGPLDTLADTLNDTASILIERLADAIGIVTTLAAPLAQSLADVVSAIPPDALNAAVVGVVALAGAFSALKGVQGVAGAVEGLGLFTTTATRAKDSAGKLATGLKTGLGKAGAVGLAVVGVYALTDALVDGIDKMRGMGDIARNLVANNESLATSVTSVDSANRVLSQSTDEVLDRLGTFSNFFSYSFGAFDEVGKDAASLANALKKLDEPLSALASVDLSAAVSQFSAYARELGATDKQVLTLLNNTPQFKKQLEDLALAQGGLATDTDLVALALGKATSAVDLSTGAFEQGRVGMRNAKDELVLLGDEATNVGIDVDALSAKILNFGSAELSTRDAARSFHDALDQLSEGIVDNGATLDINTNQGRMNEANLDNLATSTLAFAAATVQQTGDQDAANAVIAEGRQKLIDQLAAFKITGSEAESYADKLGLVPSDIDTQVVLEGVQAAQSAIDRLTKARVVSVAINAVANLNSLFSNTPKHAAGTITTGAQHAIIGEAGPEAVVPLNRPLSQVDPSVRWLSAIAQGKQGTVAMASGGVAGVGGVVFEAGSIVVQGSTDPRRTAYEVADVIAERIAS